MLEKHSFGNAFAKLLTLNLVLTVTAVLLVLPFTWMILTSLKLIEEIGADSLMFLSHESLLKAGSRKELCMACFTGQYPTALYQSPEEANKDVKC